MSALKAGDPSSRESISGVVARFPSAAAISKAVTYLTPCLVAAVVCLPCLSLGYFWDDYYFLTSQGQGHASAYLLPRAGESFYRPIPQGLYFMLLRSLDPTNGSLAHVLNLAALLGAVALMVALVWRVSGRRAGVISGIVFAGMGCVPGMVAWVSCSQDLFAIVLVLAALLLRHERRDLLALVCATAAVLSKEPAIAAFPVLILWDRLVGRAGSRARFQMLAYSSVAIAWALVHPGIHSLVWRGPHGVASGYFGITQPEQWGRHLIRYLLTLVNIPPPEFVASWWGDRLAYSLAALAILVGGVLLVARGAPPDANERPLPLKRMALIAGLFGLPTLLAPVLLIRHWAPYFACIPAVGLAMFVGPALARQRIAVVLAVLAAFLLCGAWYRGAHTEREPVWTERVFADAAKATRTVRVNVGHLYPTLPKGCQVVASVSSTGVRGIYSTLIDGQALQVWYQDPTIHTVTTQTRRHGTKVERLIRVTSDLDVISIDFDTGQVRSTTRRPDIVETELGRPILNYARSVAAEGNTARALRITEALAYSPTSEIYARRLAAMILLAAGHQGEASRILESTPALPRPVALDFVWTMLKEPSYDQRLDEAAFQAFGLSGADPETIRWMMRAFQKDGRWGQAAWYAQRLLELTHGDQESAELLLTAKQRGIEPSRMPA